MRVILWSVVFVMCSAPAFAGGIAELRAAVAPKAGAVDAAACPAPAYRQLPLDRAQCKVSHNSYDRDEAIPDHFSFDRREPWQGGCRGVEFDCRQDRGRVGETDEWRFSVQHDGEYEEGKPSLASFLNQVRDWSRAHPGHDPVFVHVELKDAFGDDALFAKKFDALLLRELAGGDPAKFYRPADLKRRGGNAGDLVACAARRGFPMIGELAGKFVVVLTGGDGGAVGARRAHYADRHLDRALAFVDRSCGHAPAVPESFRGNRVFLNVEVQDKFWRDSVMHRGERDKWKAFVRKAAATRGLIIRGWKVNDGGLWRECLEAGVNLLATDKVRDHDWAAVGAEPFKRRN